MTNEKNIISEHTLSPKRIIITESTKDILNEEIGEELDELNEEDALKAINESKKVVATKTADGKIKVRQSLNG